MGTGRNGCENQVRKLDRRQSLARPGFPRHSQRSRTGRVHFQRRATGTCQAGAFYEPSISTRNSSPKAEASGEDAGFEELAHGKAESLRLQVDGRILALTHLNKIYFPESGIRKRDLLAYYYRIAGHILPFLKGRPLVMRRYPNGIEQQSFFQKEAPESIPDWIPRAVVYSDERGGDMD